MIKKRFRWQWSENIYKLLVRTAFVILGVIGAVQVALHGIGTRSTYTAKGLKGLAVSWLREMEEKG